MADDPKDKDEPQVFDLEDIVGNQATESPDEVLAKEVESLKKDLLYLRAEYDNYRRQAIKERSELAKYAGERLARDLLSVLDIFETALESEVSENNWVDFAKGVELTHAEFKNIFDRHGIRALDSLGQPFDPHIHEAIGSEPVADVPAGHVARVFKKPFKYHDRVLRVGQVIVATKPEDNSDSEKEPT